ncbi:response regulator [Bradyrhizobium sp. dw_411]|uniref:response regulator transcription factor n=1 Tax=Bradyrhizobium sp. dw_411 TaxID=2720082 RepID=UPI001BCB1D34|nr:response regulator [Bradyrhizobium sp. dw_411]
MIEDDHTIFIVDDDDRMREALCELMASRSLRAVSFGAVSEYMNFSKLDLPSCLLLDVELPDINGLDFQEQIAGEQHPPIIFITAHGDIPASVRAIRNGAIDFLTKPFIESELLEAIRIAIAQDRISRLARVELTKLQHCLSSLTPREREVLPLVVSGLLNKQAAAELGISEVTLQIHRSKIMHKMEAGSLADLVRFAEKLQIPSAWDRRSDTS